MIRMIQRRLIIPRGDTGSFSIPYLKAINPGDVAVFTIFDIRTKTKMYQKLIAAEGDILNIAFTHGDTVNLKPGKYLWDIKFYTNPQIIDDELVNGDEVDSYYAGFSLPECEIRETGDTLLTSDDAPTSTISPESLNIINAAINEILITKKAAVEAAETAGLKADAAAESAEDASDSAAAASQSAALAEARVNEIENLSVEVDTGLEGTDASVTYTPSTGVLSFIIPRGNTGNGIASCVLNNDFTLTINYTNGDSTTTIPIRGDTPHLTIGEVTEGPHAIATITGTDANPILNLTLPNANVPTKLSQLTDDIGVAGKANSADLAAVATSGSYEDLSDKPTIPEVPVQDVQIDGNSILANKIATIPYARDINGISNYGVVKVKTRTNGLTFVGDGYLAISPADFSTIKTPQTGNYATYRPIVPLTQHRAVFYGLATAAGDITQSQSDNEIGTYTENAKTAIQTMLDVPSNAAMTTAIGTAIGNINSFDMAVVQTLPTQDISTHTIYLVPKTGETNDVYDEYVYINNAWEMVGNTQIDLSNYVQKMDYATANNAGIVKIETNSGLTISNGSLKTLASGSADIKTGTELKKPVVPATQHTSTFYGLAKAAGDSTQSTSSNAVGIYTDEAKAAIQQMLDVPSNSDMNVYATKADTVLETTLSRGRKEGTTVGSGSFAFGNDVEASGNISYAEGIGTIARGLISHAEGQGSEAYGNISHAEGIVTEASGTGAHSEGDHTKALGSASHSEGARTVAAANCSHAEGIQANANGIASHAEGNRTIANGAGSHVLGMANVPDSFDSWSEWAANTEYAVGDKVKVTTTVDNEITVTGYECKIANNNSEFIAENWTKDVQMNYVEIVGNGTADNARSNAYALDWGGNGHYMGDVYVHANADSTGGTKLATIEDIPDVPVQDVQVNGTSVVTNGVANVPIGSAATFGVFKTLSDRGTTVNNGKLEIVAASDSQIKSGNSGYRSAATNKQHAAVFYGLAKAAGADMKDIASATVGIYPDAQKEAIQSMLGITQMLAPTNPNLVASQAYSIGDVFAANGHLYKATVAIAQDEAIIPDTNCVETTMVDAGGKIKDVQVNGSTIVDNGVANVPIASANKPGTVIVGNAGGLYINPNTGVLMVAAAQSNEIRYGTQGFNYKPITPALQRQSVFYGLAQAAGVDTSQDTLAIGQYTDSEKTAIKAMLGVQDGLKVVRLI